MAKLTVSAFADEYSSNFVEQLKALNGYGFNYLEIRGVDGKNVSMLIFLQFLNYYFKFLNASILSSIPGWVDNKLLLFLLSLNFQ